MILHDFNHLYEYELNHNRGYDYDFTHIHNHGTFPKAMIMGESLIGVQRLRKHGKICDHKYYYDFNHNYDYE